MTVKFQGMDSISEYTISFHHLTIDELYTFEMLLYQIRPYGVVNKLHDLNKSNKMTPVS